MKNGDMRLVILESPYAGEVEKNVEYAKLCLHDCLLRWEAPIASHLLFTQPGILDDSKPGERMRGIEAGLAWYRVAEGCVVYQDRGISKGMDLGITVARQLGLSIEYRNLVGYQT